MLKLKLVVLPLCLSMGLEMQQIGGPEVLITLVTGEKYKGEIISVREETLVFSTVHGAGDDVLRGPQSPLKAVDLDEVREVALPGRSPGATFIGVLSAVGCATGWVVGHNQPVSSGDNDLFDCRGAEERESLRNENALEGSLLGGAAGIVAGTVVGTAVSRKGSVLFGPGMQDLGALRSVARFHDEEPEFIRRLGE